MGDPTEVRFTETNGIRCWRCCPLPLKPSGECRCTCHNRSLPPGNRVHLIVNKPLVGASHGQPDYLACQRPIHRTRCIESVTCQDCLAVHASRKAL